MGSITIPSPQFSLKETTVENLRPMKVRVIGAGFSGIYLGIRIPQRLENIDLQIYEKNEGVGGTWWENRYPGCACDIPSHSYQYSFEPNPDWSQLYAPSKEIWSYLNGVAEKYGAFRYIKLSHKVTDCKWDDLDKKWRITVLNLSTGESFQDDADILVAARGALNDIAWPKIPGLDCFKGEVMHSAAWNDDYDFTKKTVGVIGGGSSSIQIVPQLQKLEGTTLNCFVRSKAWVSNPFGDHAMQSLGLDPQKVEFSEEQRKLWKSNPEEYHKFRKVIEADGNSIHEVTFRGSQMSSQAREAFQNMMKQRLSEKPEIADKLIPSFSVGCRRLTPGPGYLEALTSDNVNFISDRIAAITPTGLQLENGKVIEVDALVCATGFNTASAPPFSVTGKGGVTLEERWKPFPESYLALTIDPFPNYFMMLGPNSGIGSGSLTMILESQGDYIIKCIRKMQKEDYASMTPKPERVRDFSEYVGEYFKRTVYMDECNSWYRAKGDKEDRIVGLWPGSCLHAIETMRSPRWEDYEFESVEGSGANGLRWLGNGWSTVQVGNGGDPAWYIEPSVVDIPKAGKPEEGDAWKARPFSH